MERYRFILFILSVLSNVCKITIFPRNVQTIRRFLTENYNKLTFSPGYLPTLQLAEHSFEHPFHSLLSSYRHVEASLLHLILDVAALPLPHIAQHLGEYELQRVVAHLITRRPVGVLHRFIAVVADIEGGAIQMAGVLRGVAVDIAQPLYVLLRAQHTGNNQPVQGHTFYI
jgi:hypothetical protein